MKHTPAPWNNRTAGDPTDKNGGQIYAGKKNIATAHYGADIDTTTATANARLIASAPELLDALNDLIGAFAKARTMRAPAGHYDEDIYYNGIDMHAQIENAREAIAKATA